ncbi:MAG TPA: hypothetical protein VMV01_07735, partial [Planctomycetota bacterium]|nr:hypothetical protein [Planctomycetota bacterium]
DFRVLSASPTLDAGPASARDVVLGLGALSTRGSRGDQLLDGEGADQTAANMGFHYTLPMDAFSSLAPLGARAAFAVPGDVTLRTRAWQRDTGAWGTATRAQALNSDVRWLVQRVSPGPKPEEIVAALADTGAGTMLYVRAWDGRRFGDDAPAVVSTKIALANADERGFDVDYEALSTDALLVHADGNNVLSQSLSDGVWSGSAPVFAPALNTGTVLWTELTPRAGTDEVALVALDDQQRLTAAIWDGTQWTRPLLLATQVNALHDFKAFDAAWESQSGDMLVAWGYSQFAEETRFANWVRSTGNWVTGQFVSTDALGMSLALASDPVSNKIVGVFG